MPREALAEQTRAGGGYWQVVADDYIELVRCADELFNSGELDAFADLFADDGEVETIDASLRAGRSVGARRSGASSPGCTRAGKRAAQLRSRKLDALATVLVTFERRATGELSGVEASSNWYSLWTLRDGRIARVRYFYERDQALAVAGLRD